MEKLISLSNELQDISQGQPVDTASLFGGFSMYTLFFGFIFSMVGVGYFRLGKKNQKMKTMILGIVLMVYPYFITNVYYLVATGLLLSFAPLIFKNFFSWDA